MLKINQVISKWKEGDIHGLDWLRSESVEQRLAFKYYESGYLKKIAAGVFAKPADKLNPFAVVRYLQEELNLKLHISGRAALQLQGNSHYLPLAKKTNLSLLSFESRSFPKWLKDYSEDFILDFRKSSLLKEEKFLNKITTEKGFEVLVASRELAILELIDELDLSNSLETVENYAESLYTLRARVLQELMEECQSVKVKRVFLYISEKLNLPYFKRLNLDTIDLGSGKRVVVEGGTYNKKYKITVDREVEDNPF